MGKTYQYKTVVIPDRGYLDDREFLELLNDEGADGWKLKTHEPMGLKLAVLLEKEIDGQTVTAMSAEEVLGSNWENVVKNSKES